MSLDTQAYRRRMYAYAKANNIPIPKGFAPNAHGLLLKPGRALLREIQRHLGVPVTSVLDAETREALMPKPTRGELVARTALANLGKHEFPWGSNTGPQIIPFQAVTGAFHAPWCASFVSYCERENGYRGPISARAYDWLKIGIPVSVANAKVGDPVVFKIGDGHIGIYLGHDSRQVKTVDGNTANEVAIRFRPFTQIAGVRHIA